MAGAERQVILLARELRRRGWRVSVVALSGTGGAAAAGLMDDDVAFLSLDFRRGLADPGGWLRFNRWLRAERPDIVHAHLPHAAWLSRWSRLCAPLPVYIDTLHSSSTGSLGRRLGYRFSRWLPHRVTAVSHAVAKSHLQARMVTPGALTVLSNGVDTEEFRPDDQTRSALRRERALGDGFLWLAVGRLHRVKNYPALLHAMARLHSSARLVIAGSGPLRDALGNLSTRLGLGERVTFLGFESDVKRWFQAADGFVLSSRWEGLPMALIEAAACGVPAVATDVPGVNEVIVDKVTGLLVPPADPVALADAMKSVIGMPSGQRHRMSFEARRHAVENFSVEAALDKWENLYCGQLSM
jgi:glycosyltransferase involved in cell wall biosynthesis